MKHITIIIFLFVSLNLFAQNTYVPDDNFEQALIDLGYDDILDDYVLTANINGIISLYISNINIQDLTGIEDFTALTDLRCNSNQLTNLDISANTSLIVLDCSSNQLTSLDVSSNNSLTQLSCSSNQLTNLNVSSNNSLIGLDCFSNQLTSLDVSLNTSLTHLYCFSNQLTSLDVSLNTSLTHLWCDSNHLTSLDLSANTFLKSLWCGTNQLTSLDIRNSNNTILIDFYAENTPNLTCIYVDDITWSETNWTNIDPASTFIETESECDALYTYVPDNNFEQALIDLGYDSEPLDDYVPTANINSVLTLDISNKDISDLTGIEDFTSLTYLSCYSNQLTSLDVLTNTSLTNLKCGSNQLTSLDISSNTALTILYCGSNQLIGLDVSKNTALTEFWCYSNQLTSLDISENTALIEFNCYSNQLTNLNVSENTALTYLNNSTNQLTSLDVSENIALTELFCGSNQLTNLDISANTYLTKLTCFTNHLTNLDVSENTALTDLWCYSNQLTSLDIRNGSNTNITKFNATDNSNLTCIFVDDKNANCLSNWYIDPESTFVETEDECNALDVNNIINDNDFTIFPNPSKEKFSIQTNSKVENIKIYDVFGKLLKVYNKQETYSVSDLATGVYLIQIKNKTGVQISKLIIE